MGSVQIIQAEFVIFASIRIFSSRILIFRAEFVFLKLNYDSISDLSPTQFSCLGSSRTTNKYFSHHPRAFRCRFQAVNCQGELNLVSA